MYRSHKRIIRIWLCVLLAVGISFPAESANFAIQKAHAKSAARQPMALVVKSSPHARYETARTWKDRSVYNRIARTYKTGQRFESAPATDIFIRFVYKGQTSELLLNDKGTVYNLNTNRKIALSKRAKAKLLSAVKPMRIKHYGKYADWSEVKERLPKFSIFKVKDLETGLSFKVQRRAGSLHIDAQPLTKRDSSVMKKIYGGHWSWKRRAVLVLKGRKAYAASMHGMPHGGDGIPDNGFRGHFCIHFRGSTTHRSGQSDLAHQLMVRKAAGTLPDFYRKASASEMAEAFFVALHQQDEGLLRRTFAEEAVKDTGIRKLLTELPMISGVQYAVLKNGMQSQGPSKDTNISAKVKLFRQGLKARTSNWYLAIGRNADGSYAIRSVSMPLLTSALISVPDPVSPSKPNAKRPEAAVDFSKAAVVIDDFGSNMKGTEEMMKLPIPITAAIMPFLPTTARDAEWAHQAGYDVIIHMPMEPLRGRNSWLGPGAILTSLSDDEIRKRVEAAVDAVPYAIGMNNHMGSKATADPRVMRIVMEVCAKRKLFFLDSRTNYHSVAGEIAEQYKVPFAANEIFLDDVHTKSHVLKQLRELKQRAANNGRAIAVGHVGTFGLVTAGALLDANGIAVDNGRSVRFIRLSEMIRR